MRKKVGILRGGKEKYYRNSLKKGSEIILYIHQNLNEKIEVFDILVDKENIWHLNGVPISPADIIHKVDLVWNLSDPYFSQILKTLGIRTLGIEFFTSVFESKDYLKENTKNIDLKTTKHIVIPVYQKDFDGDVGEYILKKAKEVHEKFGAPWIVKSFTPDTNMGMHLVKTFPELIDAIADCVSHEKSILVEEFISGKVASMHSVSGLRDQDIYVFPSISRTNQEGIFSKEEKEQLTLHAKRLHDHLGVDHYLRSNFILHPRLGIYLNSIELMPDFQDDSHLYDSCKSVSMKLSDVLLHILNRVL